MVGNFQTWFEQRKSCDVFLWRLQVTNSCLAIACESQANCLKEIIFHLTLFLSDYDDGNDNYSDTCGNHIYEEWIA